VEAFEDVDEGFLDDVMTSSGSKTDRATIARSEA
jgi:hypothetical protein